MPPAFVAIAATLHMVCTGTETSGRMGEGNFENKRERAFETRYQLDLDARRWCEGDCQVQLPITGLTADLITLGHGDGNGALATTLDRHSGRFMHRAISGDYAKIQIGSCRPEEAAR